MTLETLRRTLCCDTLLALAPRGALRARYDDELNEMRAAIDACSPARMLEELPDLLWVISRAGAQQSHEAVCLLHQVLSMLAERPGAEDARSMVKLVLHKWLLPRAERRVSKAISKSLTEGAE